MRDLKDLQVQSKHPFVCVSPCEQQSEATFSNLRTKYNVAKSWRVQNTYCILYIHMPSGFFLFPDPSTIYHLTSVAIPNMRFTTMAGKPHMTKLKQSKTKGV